MSAWVRLARHGRWLLPAGLVTGVLWPGLALAMQPAIVPLIGTALFLAALRSGPLQALPRGRALLEAVGLALLLQLALPLAAGGLLAAAGWLDSVAGFSIVLVLAAAPITGTPGLAAMSGGDTPVALRQLAVGTALLPLTAIPVFSLLPLFADAGEIAAGAGRLLLVILAAGGLAALLRRVVPPVARPEAVPVIDVAMALAMGVVVIALMGAVGPALRAGDPAIVGFLALAFGLNLVPEAMTWAVARRRLPRPAAASCAITAGNRNLALFLAALPPEAVAPILLFVGCYQIPMYLTPWILPQLLRRI